MQKHSEIKKSAGYKNKLMAQQFGIEVAKDWFDEMLDVDNQGFRFCWEAPTRIASLSLCYKHTPKNYEELKAIALEAINVEFSNLKESYVGELPTRTYTEQEVIDRSVSYATKSAVNLFQLDFYKQLVGVSTEDSRKLFMEKNSLDDLRNFGREKVEQLSKEKNYTATLKDVILEKVDSYYDKIDNLESVMY